MRDIGIRTLISVKYNRPDWEFEPNYVHNWNEESAESISEHNTRFTRKAHVELKQGVKRIV